MIRRPLFALAQDEATTLELACRQGEWLLRPWVRRRVRKALLDADARTRLTGDAHLARVALLERRPNPREPVDYDDEHAVSSAAAALSAPTNRRLPLFTLSLVGSGCVLVAAALTWFFLARPFDPTRSPMGGALSKNLAGYEVDVNKGARLGPEAAVQRVLGRRAAPAAVRAAFARLFAAYEAAADDPHKASELYAATRAADDALARHDLPYFLDARMWRRGQPLLYAFYIEKEQRGSAPGLDPERVVFLRRLDTLNISKAALGYTHREAAGALVLLNQTETFLIRDVLPGLAEGEPIRLTGDGATVEPAAWQTDIEARAARMVRESFASHAERPLLTRLGELLAERRRIVHTWSGALAGQGMRLRPPTRFLPEADYTRDLWVRVPRESRRAWDNLHAELGRPAMQDVFYRLRDQFAQDVARHELQHRFDAQRTRACDPAVPCPAMAQPGPAAPEDGAPAQAPKIGSVEARVWQETSAYLAQMTPAGAMPKMTLLSLLRPVLDPEAFDGVYSRAAIRVLDGLAATCGLADPGMRLVRGTRIDRGAVSSLAAVLLEKPEADLRDAAQRTWRRLYAAAWVDPIWSETQRRRAWRR